MIVEEESLEETLRKEHEESEVGKRQVVNRHGITVMRWCMSCNHHKVDGRSFKVHCSMTGEWKQSKDVCPLWVMARHLDRVGNPARQQMWKPKAYFEWLLRTALVEDCANVGDNRYAWWKDNVMAEGEEQS